MHTQGDGSLIDLALENRKLALVVFTDFQIITAFVHCLEIVGEPGEFAISVLCKTILQKHHQNTGSEDENNGIGMKEKADARCQKSHDDHENHDGSILFVAPKSHCYLFLSPSR